MKKFYFSAANSIDDEGVAFFLNCLNKIKHLKLRDCNISTEMEQELVKRGMLEGCEMDLGNKTMFNPKQTKTKKSKSAGRANRA